MRSLAIVFIVLFGAFLHPLWGQNTLSFTEDSLENGLKVYLLDDPNMSAVFGAVAVRAGGKYDPADATGMGHYLEHMLFKGTQDLGTKDYSLEKPYLDKVDSLYEVLGQTEGEEERLKIQKAINEQAVQAAQYAIPNEFDRLLQSIGSSGLNAFTTEEVIVYYNFFPVNQMERWLDIYAHRFDEPVFRLFQSELETVYEEKNRAMDDFIFPLMRDFQQQFYKNHPYGTQTVLGKTEHLKNPSLKKMYAYFEDYYVPNNMALILVGNFNEGLVKEWVGEKFGGLERGEVPEFTAPQEESFAGREFFKGRYTPVRAGLLGFRMPPAMHKDVPALDVLHYLLSNDNGTGRLDQLQKEKRLLASQIVADHMNDEGMAVLIFAPKLIGQSMKKAENLLLEQIEDIKMGKFSDEEFQAAIQNLKRKHLKGLEQAYARGVAMADAFAGGWTWEMVKAYEDRLEALSPEVIREVTRRYYGENYLAFYSKMGFPKKEKLEKPPYAPPQPGADGKSAYAQKFEQIPETQAQPNFVDFKKDIRSVSSPLSVKRVANPYNDIFELKLVFGVGKLSLPELPAAAEYLKLLGTKDLEPVDFWAKLDQLGIKLGFSVEDNQFVLTLEGMRGELAKALPMVGQLIYEAVADEDKMGIVVNSAKLDRKFEKKDPGSAGRAAYEYVLYGENSNYLRRPSVSQLKKMEGAYLLEVLQKAFGHEVEVHFSGGNEEADFLRPEIEDNSAELAKALDSKVFAGKIPAEAAKWVERLPQSRTEPTIYLLDRKDALQSQVYFHLNGEACTLEEEAARLAFNQYFGASMSSLVFQEIREFRSLAYSARAFMVRPEKLGQPSYLYGFVGCQADKTVEAVQVMHDLLSDMPVKVEREAAIRGALVQTAYTSRPDFRNLSRSVEWWKRKGFPEDPNKFLLPAYREIGMDDIQAYYKKHIQAQMQGLGIIITGDFKRIDLDALAKFGKLIYLDEKDIWVH